jgi:hypothetical protein
MNRLSSAFLICGFIAAPAWGIGVCSINEAHVRYADGGDVGCGPNVDAIRITGQGINIPGQDVKMLGLGLNVCDDTVPGSLLVACPYDDCASIPGDYKLSVWRGGWPWLPTCTYDLTIGAKGQAGEPGNDGVSGYEIVTNTCFGNPATDQYGNIDCIATCPGGKSVIGGGYSGNGGPVPTTLTSSAAAGYEQIITSNFPNTSTSWKVSFKAGDDGGRWLTVHAICATAPTALP